ncbi:alpha-methylacyl-CoA racemase-2 [Coleophoma cylindrospora]|uniref:Alpha-methylacyl-CoA racemase-2 n=1 Tax=Coleophoma cylindrospora TaxID=1849047 RepID=A0A3D8QJW8_9HELO|nr:alpha-methylacyl-CoA racemase-2 [Coleophoma cylindrospora]
MGSLAPYSVPSEARRLLDEGILSNPLIAKNLPADIKKYAENIRYVGSDAPSIPINWRFAESISSLKGLEASILNVLLKKKYGVEPSEVVIDTDHASLFIMSTLIWSLTTEEGEKLTLSSAGTPEGAKKLEKYFPSKDLHRQASSNHRASATNIYKTKDNRFFHLHGSMNPDPTLKSLDLPLERDTTSVEESWTPFTEKISQITSHDLQHLATDIYRQAGTICWTAEEFQASEHGQANAHVNLFDIHSHPSPTQLPGWWAPSPLTSAQRPLAGLKVLDITRVIAAPAITRGLAELGASVMRVTAPHLVDFSSLHCDLNWGKWNCCLDFTKEEDRVKLRELILEADVVVEGYRPGVLDKWGLGKENVLELCRERKRGVVYVRENCYGWNGPWMGRSGWQQISDACCGVSMAFGQAMGNDEAVTPVFPNSDYCTGVAGVSGILTALLRQSEQGGSYSVDVSLNYYSQWLVASCGVYPPAVWDDVWTRNGRQVFRHYHNMGYTIPRYLGMMMKNSGDKLFKPDYFEDRESRNLGIKVTTVKSILQFPGEEVKLGFNVGTRGNAVDAPRWPEDLSVEVVV